VFRRFGAFIVDLCLVVVLTVVIALPLRSISGYAATSDRMNAIFDRIAAEHGVDINITNQQYNALSEEEKLAIDAALVDISEDTEAAELYAKTVRLLFIVIFSSLLVSVVLLELVLPLIFKNGQTIGKKLMRFEVQRRDGEPLNLVTMLLRSITGKFFIDYGLPVFFFLSFIYANAGRTPLIGLLMLTLAQIVCIAVTSDRRALHDIIASTVVVPTALQY